MAENSAPHPASDPRPAPAVRRGGVRPLLALASLVPLALAVAAVSTTDRPDQTTIEHASAQSQPGASTSWCPGPVTLPEEALDAGSDDELGVTPPSAAISLRAVAAEPAASVLFGRVSASQTLQEEDGSVRAPSISAEDADGTVISDRPASEDLGVSVLEETSYTGRPHVSSATSEGGRAVADSVQSTLTADGDYRSLSLTRCSEPATEATFLGVSTGTGSSSVLVLRNPTERPATASVQLWTADGPASMEGRSQVVVAPGEEQRVLLESVAPGQDAVGVGVSVLGAPLSMHVQSTERDGLTPGGAEILAPLAAADTELLMPGVDVAGTDPALVLANSQGSDTSASVEVVGPDGPVDAAALEEIDVPAGTVVSTPLEGLPDGTYSVVVRSEAPLTAVTRSVRTGEKLAGDTLGAPVDFALVSPAPAIGSQALTALPGQGSVGQLTLIGTEDSAVTVVPIAADGSAGEPIDLEVSAESTASLTSDQLEVGGRRAVGVTVVPEVPGSVHAGWTQREGGGENPSLISSFPVLPVQGGQDAVTVQVAR
ncbi:hypothetical protein CFK41_06270 [Brachybacterium ginsengisoli]|uniref:Large extracellular alpha-helical protein n=1 Tax=Brachybacterium ginsengisoli TaxID=1331682 RepID=A0A291GW45_9MICO|nr:DUF5719 family protein [Brachybacterium ginsengisoli]ATG54417.1 hypothetical protein CFK41_06270 [Brachybacterium ginsengisoli]